MSEPTTEPPPPDLTYIPMWGRSQYAYEYYTSVTGMPVIEDTMGRPVPIPPPSLKRRHEPPDPLEEIREFIEWLDEHEESVRRRLEEYKASRRTTRVEP